MNSVVDTAAAAAVYRVLSVVGSDRRVVVVAGVVAAAASHTVDAKTTNSERHIFVSTCLCRVPSPITIHQVTFPTSGMCRNQCTRHVPRLVRIPFPSD